ncbi:MAG: peptidylprolyl isomerase [Alphaproteobacteria bacterium]|nr:peptidylprolyl isomerase [Alphaproteobacteria bacterium]
MLASCANEPNLSGGTTPTAAGGPPAPTATPENTLVIETKTGKIKIALRPDIAPNHVARIKKLAREGFYNGIVFHRVIPRFMAQTGDPTGTGAGGSKYPDLKAEFSQAKFERGTLGAARSQSPNSANSQFFITYTKTPHLDGQYTVFGQVIEGMEHVDRIKKGSAAENGKVDNPDKMLKVYVAADAK